MGCSRCGAETMAALPICSIVSLKR
jgi:hypothetical protein